MAPKKMKVENVEEENQKDVTEDVQTIPKPNISRIKNKILRNEMYKKLRVEKRKVMKPEFSRNSSCIVCFSWIWYKVLFLSLLYGKHTDLEIAL